MPRRRPKVMEYEIVEYLKFLHLHNLVNIIRIIESIPISYQTQIKKFAVFQLNHTGNGKVSTVELEKTKLQNLSYIGKYGFGLSFPNFDFNFQTYRMGPHSLDIENQLQNLIYSDIFNNAISSRKMLSKRYNIMEYDKECIVKLFKCADNYRNFLSLVGDRDIFYIKDIALVVQFHNRYTNGHSIYKKDYSKNYKNRLELLKFSLKDLVTCKPTNVYDTYIKEIVDLFLASQPKLRSLPSPP